MDEPTIKGMKLLNLEDRQSSDELKMQELKDERIRMRGVTVYGYDPSLRGEELANALKSRFSSCGEVEHVKLPRNELFYTGCNRSTVTIRGQNIEKKVLELNGSFMGGWQLTVQIPKMPPPRPDYTGSSVIYVSGFDRSRPQREIERLVAKHFSSCGKLLEAILLNNKVRVVIKGEGALEKALTLRACQCDVKDCKIVAEKNDPRKRRRPLKPIGGAGYTIPQDKIGRVIMTVTRVMIEGEFQDCCFALDGAKSGKLCINLKWTPRLKLRDAS